MEKRSIHNPDKRPSPGFSWALELSHVEHVLLLTGTTAMGADGVINHPGDAPAQARWILESLGRLLITADYSWDDVVRLETTVVDRLSDAEIAAVSRVAAEYIGQLRVQPAAGTLRVVSRLMKPEMLVELEMIAAR